ncbi:MAG: (deoxy)nucleoside triphosphate pyrophosphohydrolase [Deltaproteobacteria bacterium]
MDRVERSHIEVSCAIIEADGLVLVAQRSVSMSMPLKWEFPGGKIHAGESPRECLRRELMEELSIAVEVLSPLPPASHDYPGFSITLFPFICKVVSGDMLVHEHSAIRWVLPEDLKSVDLAEADIPVVSNYLSTLGR